MNDITLYLKLEILDLLFVEENWSEELENCCKICNSQFSSNITPFYLFKISSNKIYYMIFHFECAILTEFVEEFENENISGEFIEGVEE